MLMTVMRRNEDDIKKLAHNPNKKIFKRSLKTINQSQLEKKRIFTIIGNGHGRFNAAQLYARQPNRPAAGY